MSKDPVRCLSFLSPIPTKIQGCNHSILHLSVRVGTGNMAHLGSVGDWRDLHLVRLGPCVCAGCLSCLSYQAGQSTCRTRECEEASDCQLCGKRPRLAQYVGNLTCIISCCMYRSGNLVKAELHSTRLSKWLLTALECNTLDWSTNTLSSQRVHSVSFISLIADFIRRFQLHHPKLDQIILVSTTLHHTPHITHSQSERNNVPINLLQHLP
jgi:hypothetical protein